MINCLIVDDESHALELIKAYVEKLPFLNLVAACKGSLKALSTLREKQIDLIFLDIQMPDLSGFEFLKTLKFKPYVIVISAYPQFALEGYKWDIADYLLKPVAFNRFVEAVNKVRERREPSKNEKEKDHFFIRGEHKMIKIRIDELLFIESFREYAHLHLAEQKHIARKPLSTLEKILPSEKFIRVHRSYIVSIPKIDLVFGNTIRIGNHEIPVGKNYKQAFMKMIEVI